MGILLGGFVGSFLDKYIKSCIGENEKIKQAAEKAAALDKVLRSNIHIKGEESDIYFSFKNIFFDLLQTDLNE